MFTSNLSFSSFLIIFVLLFQPFFGISLIIREPDVFISELYDKIMTEIDQRNHNNNKSPSTLYFTKSDEKIEKIIGDTSSAHIKIFDVLVNNYNIPKEVVIKFLFSKLPPVCFAPSRSTSVSIGWTFCDLDQLRYRTFDGSCNNLKFPLRGAVLTPLKRLLPPDYDDGWNKPRGGFHREGSNLPNARLVSTELHQDYISVYPEISMFLPIFGQFLDHDLAISPEESKKCCTDGPDKYHLNCWPIQVFPTDQFYSNLMEPQECISFTRSSPYCFPNRPNILTPQREQINGVTSYIDASHVYGSNINISRQIRSFNRGKFRTNSQCPHLLPTVQEIKHSYGDAVDENEVRGEFFAGESRANLQPGLTVLHTIFFREHNRICDLISALKPYWNDEKIYQEARRIVIAIWQHIVYTEYLPIILGPETVEKYDLYINSYDERSIYNPEIDTSLINEFTTAAYRFGHSLVQGGILLKRGFSKFGVYPLSDNFFKSQLIHMNKGEGFDMLLNGLLEQNAQRFDTFVSEQLTNHLFPENGHDYGSDLIARNIQRGRDHGLPGYSYYREFCGLQPLLDWSSKPSNILQNSWTTLQKLYKSPLDIDLFSGSLSELPVQGGLTGHTFNCIKGIQFSDLKFGDRFFYTHQPRAEFSFTNDELEEIDKVTMSDILCHNSRLEMISKNVFKVNSLNNPLVHCKDPSRYTININVFLHE